MPKGRTAEQQFDLGWTQTLRWEELLPAQRAEARELLEALLHAVGAHEVGAAKGGDDHVE